MRGLLTILISLEFFINYATSSDNHRVVHDVVSPPIKKDQNGAMEATGSLPEWEKDVQLDGRIRYIEMLLAVDAGVCRHYGYDMGKIRKAMVLLLHGVNLYLWQLDLRVILVDVVQTPGNNVSLEQFLHWRVEESKSLPSHDVAVLIRHRYEGGIAYVGGVCKRTSVGISGFFPEAPMEYAAVFFHELAHLLGVQHESRHSRCHCDAARRDNCLRIDGFDNDCAVQVLADGLRGHECIQEAPRELPASVVPICGNGVVEEGEQCDCGPQRYCQSWLCEPRSCQRLVPNSIAVPLLAFFCVVLAFCTCSISKRILCPPAKSLKTAKSSAIFTMPPDREVHVLQESRSGDSLLPLQLPQIEPKRRGLGLETRVPVPEIINSVGYVPMNVPEPSKLPLASVLPTTSSSNADRHQTQLRLPKIASNATGGRPEISAPIAHIVASKPVKEFENENRLINTKNVHQQQNSSLTLLPPPPAQRRVYPELPDRSKKPPLLGTFTSPGTSQTLPRPSGLSLEPIYDTPPSPQNEISNVHALINRLQGTL